MPFLGELTTVLGVDATPLEQAKSKFDDFANSADKSINRAMSSCSSYVQDFKEEAVTSAEKAGEAFSKAGENMQDTMKNLPSNVQKTMESYDKIIERGARNTGRTWVEQLGVVLAQYEAAKRSMSSTSKELANVFQASARVAKGASAETLAYLVGNAKKLFNIYETPVNQVDNLINKLRSLGKVAGGAATGVQLGVSLGKTIGAGVIGGDVLKTTEGLRGAIQEVGLIGVSTFSRLGAGLGTVATMGGLAAGAILGIGAAIAGISLYKLTNMGKEWNEETVQVGLSLASIIGTTQNIYDEQGKLLTGTEAWNAAQNISFESMKRIEELALTTSSSVAGIAHAFRYIVGPATSVGVSIKQTVELSQRLEEAFRLSEIPLRSMRMQVDKLLTGNLKNTSVLAQQLGISEEIQAQWKASGDYIGNLMKHLESVGYAGKALSETTIKGLSVKIGEGISVSAAKDTLDAYNAYIAVLQRIKEEISIVNEESWRLGESGRDIQGKWSGFRELLHDFSLQGVTTFELLASATEKFLQKVGDLYVYLKNVKKELAQYIRLAMTLAAIVAGAKAGAIAGSIAGPKGAAVGAVAGGLGGFLYTLENFRDEYEKELNGIESTTSDFVKNIQSELKASTTSFEGARFAFAPEAKEDELYKLSTTKIDTTKIESATSSIETASASVNSLSETWDNVAASASNTNSEVSNIDSKITTLSENTKIYSSNVNESVGNWERTVSTVNSAQGGISSADSSTRGFVSSSLEGVNTWERIWEMIKNVAAELAKGFSVIFNVSWNIGPPPIPEIPGNVYKGVITKPTPSEITMPSPEGAMLRQYGPSGAGITRPSWNIPSKVGAKGLAPESLFPSVYGETMKYLTSGEKQVGTKIYGLSELPKTGPFPGGITTKPKSPYGGGGGKGGGKGGAEGAQKQMENMILAWQEEIARLAGSGLKELDAWFNRETKRIIDLEAKGADGAQARVVLEELKNEKLMKLNREYDQWYAQNTKNILLAIELEQQEWMRKYAGLKDAEARIAEIADMRKYQYFVGLEQKRLDYATKFASEFSSLTPYIEDQLVLQRANVEIQHQQNNLALQRSLIEKEITPDIYAQAKAYEDLLYQARLFNEERKSWQLEGSTGALKEKALTRPSEARTRDYKETLMFLDQLEKTIATQFGDAFIAALEGKRPDFEKFFKSIGEMFIRRGMEKLTSTIFDKFYEQIGSVFGIGMKGLSQQALLAIEKNPMSQAASVAGRIIDEAGVNFYNNTLEAARAFNAIVSQTVPATPLPTGGGVGAPAPYGGYGYIENAPYTGAYGGVVEDIYGGGYGGGLEGLAEFGRSVGAAGSYAQPTPYKSPAAGTIGNMFMGGVRGAATGDLGGLVTGVAAPLMNDLKTQVMKWYKSQSNFYSNTLTPQSQGFFGQILSSLTKFFSSFMNFFKSLFDFGGGGGLGGGLGSLFGADGLGSLFGGAGEGLGGGLASLIEAFPMPMMAEGGYVDTPTLAVVGESGPEYIIPKGKVQNISQIILKNLGVKPFATGGYITDPTLALIGENGPEFVIPEKNVGSMGAITNSFDNSSNKSQAITINAPTYITAPEPSRFQATQEQIASRKASDIRRAMRNL